MKTAGLICVIYYVVICLYVRRWRKGFSKFWLFLGIVLILAEGMFRVLPEQVMRLCLLAGSIAFLIFLAVEIRILTGMYAGRTGAPCSALIVLGARVDGRRMTDSLRQRLDCAYDYLIQNEETLVVVSGGQGEGELVPEGRAMAEYLADRGIAQERICIEASSSTTRENLRFSAEILKNKGIDHWSEQAERIGIVTNNYHIYRAICIAKQEGYVNLEPFPAHTTPVMFPSYVTREFFGVVKMAVQMMARGNG